MTWGIVIGLWILGITIATVVVSIVVNRMTCVYCDKAAGDWATTVCPDDERGGNHVIPW